jgi:hypothetical protein
MESIPPAYAVWRAGMSNIGLSYRTARLGIDSWASYKVYKFGLRAMYTVLCTYIQIYNRGARRGETNTYCKVKRYTKNYVK